ncbi:MAG: hypothetical protein A3C38_05975 [Planctomycetes bacterium RIFCSPHIGHO2_02_FULL_50_42]|nr:MAG: hypothetical protein A2060_03530 [Planctomycetes bacterium GWA2_50_13]OHB86787.1 MAG: hypothetical protein A3C38_05975 [Planctomycetes bacterium RIFCSPHIGHO2_02_FULL_50_42]OHB92611.1 MAG: hypothetical protein A3E75_04615 [Planctomycetes bacterium RIFCSPHIGHO2_12_FULL_51_37]OHB95403.1 MAG: hypothetical protein A3I59_08950 [Planctomycetes bacterium RIFCSPLOWO2_02_FULL_50_16]HCN19790.1 hypothetical protein [Planctomycetia bacterium]
MIVLSKQPDKSISHKSQVALALYWSSLLQGLTWQQAATLHTKNVGIGFIPVRKTTFYISRASSATTLANFARPIRRSDATEIFPAPKHPPLKGMGGKKQNSLQEGENGDTTCPIHALRSQPPAGIRIVANVYNRC